MDSNEVTVECYQHYKGGVYELLHTAINSETREEMVVYRSVADGTVWVRTSEMFYGYVSINEHECVFRFKKIE